MEKMRMKQLLVIVPMLALLLTGCTPTTTPEVPTINEGNTPSSSASVEAEDGNAIDKPTPGDIGGSGEDNIGTSEVSALLETLTVSDEEILGYDRNFFKHWISDNSTGCDTRIAVLVEESLTPVTMDGCKVTAGEWVSSYDGITFTEPSDMDIDHMVPLAEAWRSGANAWNDENRQSFANDLDFAPSLVAVSAGSNRSKGDRDPAQWLPETDACVYVANWVAVKDRWKLTVDSMEKDKILSILSWCDEGLTVGTEENVNTPEAPITETVPAPVEAPVAPVAPAPADGSTDPQFASCKEAAENGFKGPYVKDVNAEYAWYRDGDGDGSVCE
jgi:hypothetical protein